MNKFKELLFLKNIKGLGNAKINKNYLGLLDEYNDLDDLVSEIEFKFKLSFDNLENAKIKAEKLYDEISYNPEINVITLYDDEYPEKLKVMGNKKPLILYVKGNVDALKKPNIAVIGTRKPSTLSQEFESDLVKNIVKSTDRVVVSGLALGCDKIAHQTTVDEDKITIAVLPSGVNVIKPASHKNLAQKIIETGGCLVSEYEPDVGVNRGSYVERDGIVAAFSDATFVVECGIKSGTMHTVDAAKKYQRKIYAYLPEKRHDESYDGNEFILKNNDDAIKVEDINEFLDNLENLNPKKKSDSVQMTFDNL